MPAFFICQGIQGSHSRTVRLGVCAAALALFTVLVVILDLPAPLRRVVANTGWTVVSLVAGLVCLRTSQRLDGLTRRAWRWIGAGCLSWCAGMLWWSWLEHGRAQIAPFPSLADVGFAGMGPLFILGILCLREPGAPRSFTLMQLGGLGAVLSTVALIEIVLFARPLASADVSLVYRALAIGYPVLYSGVFVLALAALWATDIGPDRRPLAVLAGACGLQMLVKSYYPSLLLVEGYSVGGALDPIFAAVFLLVILAAYEQDAAGNPGTVGGHFGRRLQVIEALLPIVAVALGSLALYHARDDLQAANAGLLLACGLALAASLGLHAWSNRQLTTFLRDRVRATESRLAEGQRLEGLGRVTGAVAHDFNNLLASILGRIDLARQSLSRSTLGEQEAARDLTAAIEAVERAAALSRRLLTVGRKTEVKLQPVDVDGLIREVVTTVAATLPDRIAVRTELGSVPPCLADPILLHQALLNLGVNARDAIADGGTIVFRSRVTDQHADPIGEGREPRLVLTVSDDGCGIAPEVRRRLFEPFFTTKPESEGTGLGLATVFAVANAHGGRIDLDTAPGQGSSFHLWLPYREPMGAVVDPGSGRSPSPTSVLTSAPLPLPARSREPQTILVVDDLDDIRRLMCEVLERAGYQVVAAADGRAALAAHTTHPHVDLVLTDLSMPGLDGYGLLRQLRAIAPDLPVVVVSGHGMDKSAADWQATGFAAYLHKPFGPRQLVDAVSAVLAQRVGLAKPTGG